MTNPITSPSSGASATPATPAASAKVASVAKQFEAVFLRQMIGSMRQASLSDGMFDSSAEDQFRDMGDAKLADSMAGKGFGIAELLTRQLGGKAGANGANGADGTGGTGQ